MLEDFYPVHWAGGQAAVTLPEHIGASNAGQVRDALLSVINRGATTLIADMTATVSCDHAGADAVVRAWQRTVSSGTELRLVVTTESVSRVLGMRGLDRQISVYPSLEAAAAARLPVPEAVLAAAWPRRAGQSADDAEGVPVGEAVPLRPGDLSDVLQDALALADGDGTIAAASARQEHLRLLDAVIAGLFRAGLRLQGAADLPEGAARQRTEEVAAELDDIIGLIRAAAFAECTRPAPPPPRAPRDDQ